LTNLLCVVLATEVIEAIEKCPGIEALRLDGNTLGIDAAKAIGDALSKHKTFKAMSHFSLYRN
jgi:Ran GTPase-activating protein (RanGAP) involved in mRNA processing and transport